MADAKEVNQPHGARAHHPFSPSSLQYREACPYFENSDSSSGEAAEIGTKLHEMTETGRDDATLDDDQFLLSSDCKRYQKSILDRFPNGTIVAEEALPIDDKVIRFWGGGKKTKLRDTSTTCGFPDWTVVSEDRKRGAILDYKFGEWAVEDADNNLQGIAYLLGLRKRFPSLEEIEVHFAMPRLDQVSFHTFYREQFDDLYLRVCRVVHGAIQAREVMHKAKKETGGMFDGGQPRQGLCIFCGNLGRCNAVAREMVKIGSKFGDFEFPEGDIYAMMQDAKIAGQALQVAALAEAWAKSLKTAMLDRTIEDESDWIPFGYELATRAEREILNRKGVEDIAQTFGVTDQDLKEASSLSLGAVEKAITKITKRGQKTAAVNEFKETIEDLEHVKKGEPYSFLRVSKNKNSETEPE